MIKDFFNAHFPEDIKVVSRINNRLAVVRGSVHAQPGAQQPFINTFGIYAADGRGFPMTEEGIVLNAAEVIALAAKLAALIEAGEIKAGVSAADHEHGVADRQEFLRLYDAKHPQHFH